MRIKGAVTILAVIFLIHVYKMTLNFQGRKPTSKVENIKMVINSKQPRTISTAKGQRDVTPSRIIMILNIFS